MAYVDHKTTETYTTVEFLKAFHVSIISTSTISEFLLLIKAFQKSSNFRINEKPFFLKLCMGMMSFLDFTLVGFPDFHKKHISKN